MNTPVLIRVRERHTTHGAESLTATEDWRAAYAARERGAIASEAADFGGGDSTGVQELD
jgi:hypothetical protein